MNFKKVFLFLVLLCNLIFAQNTKLCGTDFVMQKYRNTPHFKSEQLKILNNNNNNNLSQNPKIIPLVFHIINNGDSIGEDENISIDQINDAVSILNEDYNILNEDLNNVVESFENIIGDVNVEYRLARLDPNGNCTNGINRVFSSLGNQANDCVKEVISWDDTKYVNIWVVEEIDSDIGAAAYTYLPGSLWGDEVEGIIINHEYVGSIGSSNNTPYKRHTLSHEFGHYFNLEHTWGWGTNGDLDNCSYDDGVDDTPNTVGAYSTCNLSQQSCGSLDNIQNFMDYSSCTCMFTSDQVIRMQNCLNSSVSSRNNLWTNNNLWETGTHDNYDNSACLPNVDFFLSEVDRICINSPIKFINNTEGIDNNTSFAWSFIGNENLFSSEKNPTIIFSSPGEYQVTLSVVNDIGESSLTKTFNIYNAEMNLNESFQNTQFPNNPNPSLTWSIESPESETSWTRSPISSTSETGSVRIRSRYFDCYQKHSLYTPTLNLSNFGLGVGEPLKLYFDLAYGKRNNQTNDLLQISFSKDCGKTWQVRASWDTEELISINTGNVGNNFTPNSSEWVEKIVNIQSAAEESDVIIKFEFSGNRGTYLYIDNVRLDGEWINIDETNTIENIQIIKRLDMLGRENNSSKFYINIYNDGSVQKYYEVY
jgi:PKD repeat protein